MGNSSRHVQTVSLMSRKLNPQRPKKPLIGAWHLLADRFAHISDEMAIPPIWLARCKFHPNSSSPVDQPNRNPRTGCLLLSQAKPSHQASKRQTDKQTAVLLPTLLDQLARQRGSPTRGNGPAKSRSDEHRHLTTWEHRPFPKRLPIGPVWFASGELLSFPRDESSLHPDPCRILTLQFHDHSGGSGSSPSKFPGASHPL